MICIRCGEERIGRDCRCNGWGYRLHPGNADIDQQLIRIFVVALLALAAMILYLATPCSAQGIRWDGPRPASPAEAAAILATAPGIANRTAAWEAAGMPADIRAPGEASTNGRAVDGPFGAFPAWPAWRPLNCCSIYVTRSGHGPIYRPNPSPILTPRFRK
jgi:hypothetical protein